MQKHLSESYILFILAIFVIAVQMLVNIDSYLYAINNHYDSSVFFMCGKALFNGLTPYVDFTDSKGLLLWIIYGIGYLIDHHSYIGVFWMCCLFYWLTFYINYKTARLYLPQNESLLASMGMAIPFFYWNFYTENKAEHFCTVFVSYAIYVLLRTMLHKEGKKLPNRLFWGVGIGVTACLMMKWSIAVMMISIVVSILLYAYKRGKTVPIASSLIGGIVGAFLPFYLYFIVTDSWNAFIQEYFINTLQTVQIPLHETIISYLAEWKDVFTTKRFIYIIYILPLLCLWKKKEWFASALPFLSALFFLALSIRHDNFGHYISIVTPFAIVAIVQMLLFMKKHHMKLQLYIGAFVIVLAYIVWGKIHYSETFFTKAEEKITHFEQVSYMLSQVERPTLLNIGQESGFAMGYTLPACRYWITQMGMTPQMIKAQRESLMEGKADFVALHGKKVITQYENAIIPLGYHFIAEYTDTRIYSKQRVMSPPANFKVTKTDIVLKRNIAQKWSKQIKQ